MVFLPVINFLNVLVSNVFFTLSKNTLSEVSYKVIYIFVVAEALRLKYFDYNHVL